MYFIRPLAIASLLLGSAGWAQAQSIIYQHDFNGSASTPLHGQSPDVDNSGLGSTWVTRTNTGLPGGTGVKWFDDGSIDAALEGSGAASLAFTPAAGNIYTLTASFNAIDVGAPENWVAMGFSAGQATGPGPGAEFFGNGLPDQITGQPWMLYRNSNSVTFGDQTFLGPSVNAGEFWPVPVTPSHGAPVDMRIVLDTTAPAWTAQWLAKNPADAAYTTLRTTTYATNPNILAVAITAQPTVGGSIDSFTLTVVPEPGSLLLGAMGLALLVPIVVRRRKK